MPIKLYKFQLPIKEQMKSPMPIVVQHDVDGNKFLMTLIDGDKPFDLTGASLVTFTALKEDNTVSIGNATIEDYDGGKISYTLTDQCVTLPGTVRCTVEVYTGLVRITSADFTYEVKRDLAEGADPSSSTEYPILLGLIVDVTDLEQTVETAEALRVIAEADRLDAENDRIAADDLRSTAEIARVASEGARNTAEGNRVASENARVVVEATREENETAREAERVAFKVWQAYNPLTAYVALNKVAYNGSSYIAVAPSTGVVPGTDGTKWLMIAAKGDTGAIPDVSDVVYAPSVLTLVKGTYISGDVSDLGTLYSGLYQISEVGSSQGADIELTYADVVDFNRIRCHARYHGTGSPHLVNIEIYDYISVGWVTLTDFTMTDSLIFYDLPIDSTRYVSVSGESKLRFNHPAWGNTDHFIDIDYAALVKSYAGAQGIQGEPGPQGIPGINGEGAGDMIMSVYDTDEDGKVNEAELADAVPWSGITGTKNLSDMTEDSNHRSVTDTEITTWGAKQDHSADLAKFKAGTATYTDNDTSQTFADAFCTANSKVEIVITGTPAGKWSVVSADGSFTITSDTAESADVTFDYYITKVVG